MRHLLSSAIAASLVVPSLAAQSVSEVEPNDTSATANTITAGVQSYGDIGVAGDIDYYAFTLTSTRDVRAMTSPGFTAQSDTILELIASDGTTVLAANDDFTGRNLYSQVTAGALAAGTYYWKVRHFNATSTGGYTLDYYSTPAGDMVAGCPLSPAVEGPEVNDPRISGGVATASTVFTRNAGNAALGAGATSYTNATADYDFYAFTVTTTGSHVISTLATGTAAPPVCADTVIFLVDAANVGTVLASNDDFSGLYSQITFNITTPGTYYAVVKCYGAGDEGNYLLDISGPCAIAPTTNATWTAATGGCAGSNGTPTLSTRVASSFNPERPMLGTEFVIDVTNVAVSSPLALMIGTLAASPIDLTNLGAPGCILELDPVVFQITGSTASGYYWWSLPIPYDLGLRGVQLEFQAAVFDPPANALDVVLSNRGTAVLGNAY